MTLFKKSTSTINKIALRYIGQLKIQLPGAFLKKVRASTIIVFIINVTSFSYLWTCSCLISLNHKNSNIQWDFYMQLFLNGSFNFQTKRKAPESYNGYNFCVVYNIYEHRKKAYLVIVLVHVCHLPFIFPCIQR